MIVRTIQALFIFKQKDNSYVPTISQNHGQKTKSDH